MIIRYRKEDGYRYDDGGDEDGDEDDKDQDGDENKDCLLAHDLTNQLNKKNENEFFKWINILDDIASNKGTGSFYHFINLIYTNLYFGNKNINQIFGKNTFNYYWDNEYKSLFLWFGKDYLKIINKVEF